MISSHPSSTHNHSNNLQLPFNTQHTTQQRLRENEGKTKHRRKQRNESNMDAGFQLPPGVDLCLVPAVKPPPGVIPNFDNPASLATAIIAVSAVMLTISTIFLVARAVTNFPKYSKADCKYSTVTT